MNLTEEELELVEKFKGKCEAKYEGTFLLLMKQLLAKFEKREKKKAKWGKR